MSRNKKLPTEETIFKQGSTTYYWSSKFFPADIRDDVFKLYSFVRVADDYVDAVPADTESFQALKELWNTAKQDQQFNTVRRPQDSLNERVTKNIIDVVRNYKCDPVWIDSFLDSMQADLDGKSYQTLDDTLRYIYGSAEVIGLMMARIMGLPEEALPYAQMQGRAMQFINFIRDIDEDNGLGRCYFPADDLHKYGLQNLTSSEAQAKSEAFNTFIQFQIDRYKEWQSEADQGMGYIPKRLRVPLQTAVDMYNWTATQIEKNPRLIYEIKVKPRKTRVIAKALKHTFVL